MVVMYWFYDTENRLLIYFLVHFYWVFISDGSSFKIFEESAMWGYNSLKSNKFFISLFFILDEPTITTKNILS